MCQEIRPPFLFVCFLCMMSCTALLRNTLICGSKFARLFCLFVFCMMCCTALLRNTLICVRGLREMGYKITRTNLKPRFVLDLLEKEAELCSSSEIAKANTIELEEIAKGTEDLISQINKQTQTEDLFGHPLRELLG